MVQFCRCCRDLQRLATLLDDREWAVFELSRHDALLAFVMLQEHKPHELVGNRANSRYHYGAEIQITWLGAHKAWDGFDFLVLPATFLFEIYLGIFPTS